MKVLFVSSGNSKYHKKMPPFIYTQALSLQKEGVEIDFFQIHGKGVRGYLRNIFLLRKFLKHNQYPIIHAHYGFSGIVALFARRSEKLIVSFMGADELFLEQSVQEGEFRLLSRIWPMANKFFAKYFFDFIIFKSENLANALPSLKNKLIIPNGVDFTMFREIDKAEARKVLGWDPSKKYILWIGNQNRSVKGFALAEKAIDELKNPSIVFMPVNAVDNNELPYYYCASDVFFLSSLSEGSPNVVKEAMACNCPIVATDVGDVKWLMEEVKGCFLVRSFNPSEMAQLLVKAIDFPARSNGREKLVNLHLDSRVVAQKIVKLYNDIKTC